MRTALLGDIVEIKGGGTPDRSNPLYWDGPIPWASVKDFKSSEIRSTLECITTAGVDNSATNIIRAGCIIVPTRMAVGKAAINVIDIAINQDLKAIQPGNEVDAKYLLHILTYLGPHLERQASGATVKGITLDVLRSLPIFLPPLDEQRRIAAILDQADALRRKRRDSLTMAASLTPSIFSRMFGDPLTASCDFLRLDAVAELINGDRSSNYPSGHELQDFGIPFLSTRNIIDNQLDLAKCNYISRQKFKSLSRGKLNKNDIIITLRGTLGQCAEFDCSYDTGFINAQMMIVRPGKSILPRYLLGLLTHPRVQSELLKESSGSAVPQLTAGQIGRFKVKAPPAKEQQEYVACVTHISQTTGRLKLQAAQLDALFGSLQHRAFRGEL